MPHSGYFIHKTHKKRLKILRKKMSMFERVVLIVSFAYPLSALPQAIQVFQGNVQGVSFLSWLGFLLCASLFFVYGIKYKVFPMIISNFLWVIMDSLVVVGILVHKMV